MWSGAFCYESASAGEKRQPASATRPTRPTGTRLGDSPGAAMNGGLWVTVAASASSPPSGHALTLIRGAEGIYV